MAADASEDEPLEPGKDSSTDVDLDKFVLRGVKKNQSLKNLTKPVEYDLLVKVQDHKDKDALGILWKHHERLVADIAYRYKDKGVPLCDLQHEGYMGWHEGVLKWDRNRGNRLSTVVYIYIKSAIYKAYLRGKMIKITATKPKDEKKRKTFDALEGLWEQANKDGQVNFNKKGSQKPLTMDTLCLDEVGSVSGNDDQLALHERIRCNRLTPDESISASADMQHIQEVLNNAGLDERQIEFVYTKWGLWDRVVKTHEDMSTAWRMPIDEVKAYDEEIFRKIYRQIDQNKLSIDYFDKRTRKKYDND